MSVDVGMAVVVGVDVDKEVLVWGDMVVLDGKKCCRRWKMAM